MTTFTETLSARIARTHSRLCVGLDPRPDLIQGDVLDFLTRVVEETADETAIYKPNAAYFEAMGVKGYEMLETLIARIPAEIPVLLDAKRSDIPETMKYYAKAYFEKWNVAAITLNPYLGFDSIEPFLDAPGKGVYLLAVTSNRGAHDIELQETSRGAVFEHVLQMVEKSKGRATSVGFVVGLTLVSDTILAKIPDVPLLLPGLGAQGGDLSRLSRQKRSAPIVINASRGILYEARSGDFRGKARELKDRINDVIKG